MKKILLGLLIITGIGAYAQDLTLINSSNEDISGTTIDLTVTDIAEAEVDFHIHNAGAEKSVKMEVIHVSDDESGFSYCVGTTCVMPNTAMSPASTIANGADLNVEFHIMGNDFLGDADYKLRIFNVDNPSEEVLLFINFTVEEPVVTNEFSLVNEDGDDISGTTIDLDVTTVADALVHFSVQNNDSDKEVRLQVEKVDNNTSGFSYCIGTTCVMPNTALSPATSIAADGTIDVEFHLVGDDFTGDANYKLKIYNDANPSEELILMVNFTVTPIVNNTNFSLLNEDGEDITGGTVTVSADSTKNAQFGFTFNNTGSEEITMQLQVIKESNDATGYTFCIGTLCVQPNTPMSPEQVVAAGASLDIEFDLVESTYQGPANYKLKFFNVDNPSEEVFLDIDFDIIADIPSLLADKMISDLYPNPANDFVNVELTDVVKGDLQIDIYNMLGKKINSYFAEGNMGVVSIPVSEYENGTYFCIFSINGESIKTEKLIIH